MKFTKTTRDDFLSPNIYTPGPGQYTIRGFSEKTSKRIKIDDTLRTTFSKDRRFKYETNDEETPGPGYYVGSPEWKSSNNKAPPILQFVSNPRKIITIPSIPSTLKGLGYIEREDGFLIPLEDPEIKEENEIGPGAYNPSYDGIKKKPKGIAALKYTARRFDTTTQDKSSTVGPGSYDINRDISSSPQQTKAISKAKKTLESTNSTENSPIKSTLKTIEDDTPGPGSYYNPTTASSIKKKMKPTNLQCFDSSTQRFFDLVNLHKEGFPGPGAYTLEPPKKITEKEIIGLGSERFKDIKQDTPGPGNYDPMLPSFKKESILKEFVEFPSAFGSTAKRFKTEVETIEDTPGPGHYNPKKDFKKPQMKKRYKTFIIPAVLPEEALSIPEYHRSENSIQQEIFQFEKRKGAAPLTIKKKLSSQPSSSFASKSIRFNQGADQASLPGPGSYSIKNNKAKPPGAALAKTPRDNQSYNTLQSYKAYLGPGSYDYTLNAIRPNSNYTPKINPVHWNIDTFLK